MPALTGAVGLVMVLVVGLVGDGAARADTGPRADAIPAAVTLGVLRQHLAYEAELLDGAMPRLTPGDASAARAARDVLMGPDRDLELRMARAHVSVRGARAEWDAKIGTGAPRPGELTHFVCSIGLRRSDAQDLAATPGDSLAEELASIELGLMVEGRQLASTLAPSDPARGMVDRSQREALHALVPLLIPTDREFAASA